ncbi:MAG: hypothetical protein ACR2PX_15520 [Endozoicomonas sp.]|uniref:hypothetical protein n=1 Tax=Endozoicomonas sp. TaxID=1892382 RepID=UPI003D9B0FA3
MSKNTRPQPGDILILTTGDKSLSTPSLLSEHVALYLGDSLYLSVHGSEMKIKVQTRSELLSIYPGTHSWHIHMQQSVPLINY